MDYETKFAHFIEALREAKTEGVECILISNPRAIGDTYEEIIESLALLAETDLALRIVPPREAGRSRPNV